MSSAVRGSTLIAVLLLIALLLVSGMALLGRKALEYDRVAIEALDAQALALAQSGLEDALLKYRRDLAFPPLSGTDRPILVYTEEVYRGDGTTLVGRYTVTIDTRLASKPSLVALIKSTGVVGTENEPLARHTVSAELDLNGAGSSYFRLLNYQDSGAH